jgi:DNA-binding NarL/FixJ family response regulator
MTDVSAATHATEPCRIVVADDHAIIRDGLSAILVEAGGFDVVGTANDGKAAVEAVGQLRPDLLVIDLTMPHTDGAEAIRVIKQRYPDVRIVVLTYHKEDAYIHAAIKAGADGYVLKDDGREDLLSAIHNVASGKSFISPAICDRVMSGYVSSGEHDAGQTAAGWEQLTDRERQVLRLVAEGYKTKEIADYLSLSKKTVEKHRSKMMRKLNLSGISAVTAYAIENGLLS